MTYRYREIREAAKRAQDLLWNCSGWPEASRVAVRWVRACRREAWRVSADASLDRQTKERRIAFLVVLVDWIRQISPGVRRDFESVGL